MQNTPINRRIGFTDRKIGFVGAIIEFPHKPPRRLYEILHEQASLFVSRLSIPNRERHLSIISFIVDGSTDEISTLTENRVSSGCFR